MNVKRTAAPSRRMLWQSVHHGRREKGSKVVEEVKDGVARQGGASKLSASGGLPEPERLLHVDDGTPGCRGLIPRCDAWTC